MLGWLRFPGVGEGHNLRNMMGSYVGGSVRGWSCPLGKMFRKFSVTVAPMILKPCHNIKPEKNRALQLS